MSIGYESYQRLRFDRPHPRVLRITMDNGRMNTADAAMHAELVRIWQDIDRDDSVACAIITGAGKTFSAGGDFAMVRAITEDFDTRTRVWREARDMVYGIINCRKPVVSAMRGVAVGAGLVCGILADAVAAALGRSFRPKQVLFVLDLPKTRSMKVMRRVVRSALAGEAAGDLSSLVNPEALNELRRHADRMKDPTA